MIGAYDTFGAAYNFFSLTEMPNAAQDIWCVAASLPLQAWTLTDHLLTS
jgi:hypothetical protein